MFRLPPRRDIDDEGDDKKPFVLLVMAKANFHREFLSIFFSGEQIAALKKQAIYVRIDSEKASDGNVQGWLEGTK